MVWWCCCCGVFDLRPYQTALATAGDEAMLRGQRPCLVSGTGSGKTVVLAEGARRALARSERVVAICHRDSIHEQIVSAIRRHCPGEVIAEIVAGGYPRLDRRVTVGMVPTMDRRLDRLAAFEGCTLFVDEAHHLPTDQWQRVEKALRPRKVCGLTATPLRPDGRGLGDTGTFDVMFKGPPIAQLMAEGSLCREYEIIACKNSISSKGLPKRGGDYSTREMEKRVAEINGDIVRDWLTLLPGRLPTITVAVSVRHAHEVAAMYQAAGVPAAVVDGKMSKERCKEVYRQFGSGRITVLVACAKVDEGLDLPCATVLQILRPINSLRLHRQLVGRVIRPGKPRFYILDHTDTWSKPHLGLPDSEIDWQLNADRQEPTQRLRVVRDEETGLVRADGELPPVEVEENGARMEVLSPAELARSHPIVARRLLNERCRAEIVQGGTDLRRWLNCLDVLEDETLRALGAAPSLRLPSGWAEGQMMLRMLLSPGQRLAATKRLQRHWMG
jgi:DNA repair protein RadD